MNVTKICVGGVDLADEQEAVWKAAERMRQRAVGGLVVVNESGNIVGMLTDRDLVQRVVAPGQAGHAFKPVNCCP